MRKLNSFSANANANVIQRDSSLIMISIIGELVLDGHPNNRGPTVEKNKENFLFVIFNCRNNLQHLFNFSSDKMLIFKPVKNII